MPLPSAEPTDCTRLQFVDSHTGGEPTRVITAGFPSLGTGTMRERLHRFQNEFDCLRSAIVREPRGSDAVVGALLCQPQDPTCAAGVIFFNNVGFLNMCGHGTIGLVATLAHLGRISPGSIRIETPAGIVEAQLCSRHRVTITNVPSYRTQVDIALTVPGFGEVHGDVAWGGNWFFLTHDTPCDIALANLEMLTDYSWRIRQALAAAGIAGLDGAEIDHIELYGPPTMAEADSKNFVLCPGKSYDRSPCGTGTSAKLACLYADGRLQEGDTWRQESLIGSLFEGSVSVRDGHIYPSITGSAHITAEGTLVLEHNDPFRCGIS